MSKVKNGCQILAWSLSLSFLMIASITVFADDRHLIRAYVTSPNVNFLKDFHSEVLTMNGVSRDLVPEKALEKMEEQRQLGCIGCKDLSSSGGVPKLEYRFWRDNSKQFDVLARAYGKVQSVHPDPTLTLVFDTSMTGVGAPQCIPPYRAPCVDNYACVYYGQCSQYAGSCKACVR